MAGAHHKGKRYVILGQAVVDAATANPHAVCWRDGWTLEQHRSVFPGRKLTWHKGHTIKGSTTWQPWGIMGNGSVTQIPPLPGDWLAPEVSTCNIGHGNRERQPHSGWL